MISTTCKEKSKHIPFEFTNQNYNGKFLCRRILKNSFQRHFSKWTHRFFHIDTVNATLHIESVHNDSLHGKGIIDVFDLEFVNVISIDDPLYSKSSNVSSSNSCSTTAKHYYLSVYNTKTHVEIWMQFKLQSLLAIWETKLKSISFEKQQIRKKKYHKIFVLLCDFIIQRRKNIQNSILTSHNGINSFCNPFDDQFLISKDSNFETIVNTATLMPLHTVEYGGYDQIFHQQDADFENTKAVSKLLSYKESIDTDELVNQQDHYEFVVREENNFAIVDIEHRIFHKQNTCNSEGNVVIPAISTMMVYQKPKLSLQIKKISNLIATLDTLKNSYDMNKSFFSNPQDREVLNHTTIIDPSLPAPSYFSKIRYVGSDNESILATNIKNMNLISALPCNKKWVNTKDGYLRSIYSLPAPQNMHIVILVVGTWGDVKPFILIGKKLKTEGHHRVRIATHSCYRNSVIANGLEFYPLSGDPHKLSEFMVKNKGSLVPLSSVSLREVPQQLGMLADIMDSCWDACIAKYSYSLTEIESEPFIANAIISNPVAYGHIHCAEKLNIFLHFMFPQPWVPTKAFPHPLSCLSYESASWSTENKLSYHVVDAMVWLTLHSSINQFRTNRLGLKPIPRNPMYMSMRMQQIPFCKMWSNCLVPKPRDWPSHVDIVGSIFTLQENDEKTEKIVASDSNPLQDPILANFLNSKSLPLPIFIGFGSMMIDEAEIIQILEVLIEACAVNNVRLIFQSGWTKLQNTTFISICKRAAERAKILKLTSSNTYVHEIFPNDESLTGASEQVGCSSKIPSDDTNSNFTWHAEKDAILITECDHNWLFKHVCAVIHHGGAGTTSNSLLAGCPTWIIPFFGDQFFWGEIIRKKMLGPAPCTIKQLTLTRAIESIAFLLLPQTKISCKNISRMMLEENGVDNAIDAFYSHLPYHHMLCEVSIFMNLSNLGNVVCEECGNLRMTNDIFQLIHCDELSPDEFKRHIPKTCNSHEHHVTRNVSNFGATNYEAENVQTQIPIECKKSGLKKYETFQNISETIQNFILKIRENVTAYSSTFDTSRDFTEANEEIDNFMLGNDGKFYNDEISNEIEDYTDDLPAEFNYSDDEIEHIFQSTVQSAVIDKNLDTLVGTICQTTNENFNQTSRSEFIETNENTACTTFNVDRDCKINISKNEPDRISSKSMKKHSVNNDSNCEDNPYNRSSTISNQIITTQIDCDQSTTNRSSGESNVSLEKENVITAYKTALEAKLIYLSFVNDTSSSSLDTQNQLIQIDDFAIQLQMYIDQVTRERQSHFESTETKVDENYELNTEFIISSLKFIFQGNDELESTYHHESSNSVLTCDFFKFCILYLHILQNHHPSNYLAQNNVSV